jgi:hypothetical protein
MSSIENYYFILLFVIVLEMKKKMLVSTSKLSMKRNTQAARENNIPKAERSARLT